MCIHSVPLVLSLGSLLANLGPASADAASDLRVGGKVDDADLAKLQALRDLDIDWLRSVQKASHQPLHNAQEQEMYKLTKGADLDTFKAVLHAFQSTKNNQAMVHHTGMNPGKGRHGRRMQGRGSHSQAGIRRLHIVHNTANTTAAAPAAEVEVEIDYLGGSDVVLDHMWLLICGTFVFFMHAGFAMLEAGTGRAKNVQAILTKNLITVCAGTIGWYLMGWSLAYGGDTQTLKEDGSGLEECDMDEHPMGCGDGYADNGFIGGKIMWVGSGFLGKGTEADAAWAEGKIDPLRYGGGQPVMWFFQWAFCTAGASIVSGGVAERVKFTGYTIFSLLMSAFIYPVVVCSTWGYGWLEVFNKDANAGYIDFAGSGVVHLTGGIGALMGAIIIGRRTGRYDPEWDQSEFDPHSQPLIVLGTFILWFGWCGFNPGSTLGMSDNGTALKAAHVMMNTTLSAACGGLTVFILRFFMLGRKYDLGALCNGILAGLVSITAGCSNVESGSAFLIGIIGGFVYCGSSALVRKARIDDPVDAFSVHGACGIWGCIAAALFDFGAGMDKHHGWSTWSAVSYGEEGADPKYMTTADALAANLAEVAFVLAWSGGLSAVTFGTLKMAGILRLDEETEMMGTDSECASPKAYNMESGSPRVSVKSETGKP